MAIAAKRAIELSRGDGESRTLAEILSIDFETLVTSLGLLDAAALQAMPSLAKIGIAKRMRKVADVLIDNAGSAAVGTLTDHGSDTVRGIAAFAAARLARAGGVPQLLSAIEGFADDPHFGVREWAWLAVRDDLAALLDEAIAALVPWTASPRPFIRRFAVEVLRPRGVWARHIATLRREPARGLPLLEPLKREREKYVQDSVANWLNDAAKDQPDFVRELCARWLVETENDPATRRICARAQRSLK